MTVAEPIEETTIKNKLDYMPMYKIIMWNDNYTTMEFVIKILIDVFQKNSKEAEKLMMIIHQEGSGIVDVMPLEHAEMKINKVHELAQTNGFPLQCTLEKC